MLIIRVNQSNVSNILIIICFVAGSKYIRLWRDEPKHVTTPTKGSWCQISQHNEVNSHFTKALSTVAPLRPYPQDFIIFPAF